MTRSFRMIPAPPVRRALLPAVLAAVLAAGLASLALPLSLAAQQRDRSRDRDTRDSRSARDSRDDGDLVRLDTTIAFGPNGTVDLSQISGSITVTAWNRREAKISANTEYGYLRADLSGGRISLEVRSRRGRIGDSEFRLQVPVGTRVIARSISGDVTVTGLKAQAELRSVSGDIEVSDAADQVTLESVSGSVKGHQLAGSTRAQSVSGDIEMVGVTGDIDAGTTSGEMSLRDVKSANVRAETLSGDLDYRGTIDKAGRYEFKSHSGEVRLTMPEGSGATFSVSTWSGSVESVIPMRLEPSSESSGRGRTKRMEFTIGGGGARVSVSTFSGDITIERAGARGKREE